MTSHRDYDRAYRMNQHPALNGKDRVTALWYASDEKFAAAMAEMEAAIEASGIPLDLEAIERTAIENRLDSLAWELDNPMRRHERERRDGLLAERKELEDRLAALDATLSTMQAEHDEGRVGDTPVNLLDAVRAAGLRPNVPVTLNTVADLVCAAVCASTSLDERGRGSSKAHGRSWHLRGCGSRLARCLQRTWKPESMGEAPGN